MADCKKYSRVPSEYQELTFIHNNGTQYIDTGLKGSDLADCELEIAMRNDISLTTAYNFNGTYLSGSTAQFGLVATSSSECRSSMNFGFADAISTTGLSLSEFHTIYATNGLQKVDNIVVGTLNFGTLNDGNFLLFARTDPSQGSGINICAAMSLKKFTVKRNNQYIRNMIPVRRKSDNQLGLYDLANNIFYTNQGSGSFTAGSDVNNWQHSLRKLTTATDTITTLPADIYADGNNATVGLVGNMSQTGTPSPDNPIQPQETGDRTGNLFDKTTITTGKWKSTSGDTTVNVGSYSDYIAVDSDTDYYVTAIVGQPSFYSGVSYDSAKTPISNIELPRNITSGVIHTPANCAYIILNFSTNKANEVMLNAGSSPLPYEPYGYKIPISSNSITTPVYLGEVETTRQIKKLVLTGEESFYRDYERDNSWRFYSLALVQGAMNNSICSHFEYIGTTGVNSSDNIGFSLFSASQFGCRFPKSVANTVNEFKAWLAQQYANGTPVTVWYVLATPETGILNEPLRKIGNYADTVSGITIPTITGADSFDVETTLKPSEVELTYTGWHDASVKEAEVGNNLFDYTTMSTSAENSYLNPDGTIGASNDWNISDYIPCSGTSFTIGYVGGNTPAICLYDKNKQFITGKSYNTGGVSSKQAVNITSQSTARYIRFSYCLASGASYDDISRIMLNKGSSLLPYEPYDIHWT